MKRALNWQSWRKLLTSSAFWGGPASLIALIFLGSADMPYLEKMVPNQDTEVAPKVHFSLLRVRPFSSRRVRQASRFATCSSDVRPRTKMLSWMEVHPGRSVSAALTLSWNNSVAGEAPKNRTLNRCSLREFGMCQYTLNLLPGRSGGTHDPCPFQKIWWLLVVCV